MTKYREILRLSGLGLSQKNIADKKIYFLFQVIAFLGESFFPFIGRIDSCLKCFYHFFQIAYHVLQLTELDIFGTVCHRFFLLFLMVLLYQKTADLQDLKVLKRQKKTQDLCASFYAVLIALGCSISMFDISQSNSRHVRLHTSDLFCGKAAVGGNYKSTRDNIFIISRE